MLGFLFGSEWEVIGFGFSNIFGPEAHIYSGVKKMVSSLNGGMDTTPETKNTQQNFTYTFPTHFNPMSWGIKL